MTLTKALKDHCVAKFNVAADASDDVFKKTVGEKLADGSLDTEAYANLIKEKAVAAGESAFVKAMKEGIAAGVKEAVAALRPDTVSQTPAGPAAADLKKTFGGNESAAEILQKAKAADTADPNIVVKAASSMYKSAKLTGRHVKTGDTVFLAGKPVEHASEQELAKFGAFMKYKFNKAGVTGPLNEHEAELVKEVFADAERSPETHGFTGQVGETEWVEPGDKNWSPQRVKALLDESGSSGGQALVPIWFDDMVVTYPLLNSELMPFVEIREVPRGSRMVAATLGNPTVSWGTAEGSALSLFTTTALASEIDTTIYPVMVGVEVGLDFLADSPVNVGQMLQDNVGQSALKEMDNVIANGSGSSRPTGIFNTSGVTAIGCSNGAGGPWTVDDMSNLIFGIGKEYRAKPWNPSFIMNDTTYKRLRNIPVGPSDERRVFGLDYQGYSLLEYPVKIQNSIANGSAAFVCLKKFRLYRRKGFDMQIVREGITLAKTNTMVVLGRGRFGGKMMDPSAMSMITTGQS